jgi:hypothetical protein
LVRNFAIPAYFCRSRKIIFFAFQRLATYFQWLMSA